MNKPKVKYTYTADEGYTKLEIWIGDEKWTTMSPCPMCSVGDAINLFDEAFDEGFDQGSHIVGWLMGFIHDSGHWKHLDRDQLREHLESEYKAWYAKFWNGAEKMSETDDKINDNDGRKRKCGGCGYRLKLPDCMPKCRKLGHDMRDNDPDCPDYEPREPNDEKETD